MTTREYLLSNTADASVTERGPYLRKNRVADRYDVTPRTLDRWTRDPELQFPQPFIVSGHVFYSLPELQRWDSECAQRGRPHPRLRSRQVEAA
jgi:hypothetical protein